VKARILRIDRAERRIGLSIKAASMADDEFEKQKDEILEGLKPGEHMVDLAGAFDEALGQAGMLGEEWRPGDKKGGAKAESED